MKLKYLAVFLWCVLVFFITQVITIGLHEIDFWWHLNMGRIMVESKSFIRQENLSHTIYGTSWINFQWFPQVVAFSTWNLLGFKGVYFLKTILCLSCVILMSYSAYKKTNNPYWHLILTAWGFLIIFYRLLEKPELVTLLMFSGFVLICSKARSLNKKLSNRYMWVLFIGMVIWVNSHAGFVYGIGLLFLFLLGAYFSHETKNTKIFLIRSLILCCIALIINPSGPYLLNVFTNVFSQGITKLSTDFMALKLDYERIPYWLMFFITLLISIWMAINPKLKKLRFWGPVVIVFSLWSLKYMRNMVFLPLVALPFISEFISLDYKRFNKYVTRDFIPVIVAILILIPVGVLASYIKNAMPKPYVTKKLPTGALQFIKENNISGNMFNEINYGGYLGWELYPNKKIFMDGRYIFVDLMKELDTQWKSMKNDFDGNTYNNYFNKHNIDYAIVSYSPKTNIHFNDGSNPFPINIRNIMFRREEWALVYWDDHALLFLRRGENNSEVILNHEYKNIWPYNVYQMSYLLEKGGIQKSRIESEMNRHEKTVGQTSKGMLIKGLIK